LTKDYMEMLLNVVDDILQNEDEFNRAKIQSQIIAGSFKNESFAVILTALYLSVLAVIDTVDMKNDQDRVYN